MPFKLHKVGRQERSGRGTLSSYEKVTRIVGKANEVPAVVNGRDVLVLLYYCITGSMVSTISSSFCAQLWLDVQPLEDILTVEGAGGHKLPYSGFTEVEINFKGLSSPMDALMLVVPDTPYHKLMPMLIGTNVLGCIEHAPVACDSTLKIVVANIAKQQVLNNASDSLSLLTTSKPIVIPPNGCITVIGQTRVQAISHQMSVCLESSEWTILPKGVLVSPCVNWIQPGQSITKLPVQLTNQLDQMVTIPAKARICKLYSMDDVSKLKQDGSDEGETSTPSDFLHHFAHIQHTLDEKQQKEVNKFLNSWKSLFSLHDLDLGLTNKAVHRIDLKDNTPFKERPRTIPPSMFEEVRAHLKEMQELGVIRRSQSPNASNVVIVRKKNGALRFCLDMRLLNTRTIPDKYNLSKIDVTLGALAGSQWFCCLDLKSGYWQVPLAEEDKCKTAFTVVPLGFWECERMPFG